MIFNLTNGVNVEPDLIEILGKAPVSLTITGDWTNPQIKGEEVDPTGLVFTVKYNDNTTAVVSNVSVSPSTWESDGEQEATFTYDYKGLSISIDMPVYVRNPLYVGTLVKRKATEGEKYITSIFYGQKASGLTSSSVVYEFYYSNDNGTTFKKFYQVNAKDIVDGNGKTSGSTTLAINEAIHTEITEGRATSSSVIYYAVIDEENEYQTNSDAYASFYMYIPADSGVNVYSVGNEAKSAGSSFSKTHYGDIISGLGTGGILRDNYEPTAGGAIDEKQPTSWLRLSWDNTTPNVQRLTDGSFGESNFSTGRTILSQLKTWIGNDATKKGYYYGGITSPKSAWDLLDLANNQNALYDDWFIPSFGEMEQMRGSFGYKVDSNIYFGKATLGETIYNTPSGTANTIITSSVGGTNTVKGGNKYKVAIFWSIPTKDYEQAWFAGVTTGYPCNSLVLVRTF